jgi:hypothetical protein
MDEKPKVSKSQQKAVNKYVKANYDRVNVTMPKGQKGEIKTHSETHGESVNGFINRAILEAMERDRSGITPAPSGGCTATTAGNTVWGTLAPATIHTAQEAAKASGEETEAFVTRAIEEQAKRDTISRKLGVKVGG